MIFTDKFKLGLQLINSQRDLPNRKDGSPYMAHPYGVALLLSQVTGNEDIILGGLLHDIVEDTGSEKQITIEDIKNMFGNRVYELVEAMTEDKSIEHDERKILYLEKLKTMDQDMLLVKSADILHNTGTFLFRLKQNTETAIEQFGKSYSKSMETLRSSVQILNEVWKENPLLEDLNFTLSEIERHTNFCK